MLKIKNVTKRFGGVVAVNDVSLNVDKGEILGIIGPNGAGKTTLINLINGFLKPNAGEIYYKEERIDGMMPHEVVRKGIGRTFQITLVFRKLTVLENMLVTTTWRSEKESDSIKKAHELLNFFDLYHMRSELAGNLSGGQQKLLELAVASMLNPELFLLDEPFYGIHSVIKKKIIEDIETMNQAMGKTFAIISHDIPSIMTVCREVMVMNAGELIARGTPEDVRNDSRVIEVYLGE